MIGITPNTSELTAIKPVKNLASSGKIGVIHAKITPRTKAFTPLLNAAFLSSVDLFSGVSMHGIVLLNLCLSTYSICRD